MVLNTLNGVGFYSLNCQLSSCSANAKFSENVHSKLVQLLREQLLSKVCNMSFYISIYLVFFA